jgi:hypothetical protein
VARQVVVLAALVDADGNVVAEALAEFTVEQPDRW